MLHTGRDSDARIRSCSLRCIIGSRAILKFKSSSMDEIKCYLLMVNSRITSLLCENWNWLLERMILKIWDQMRKNNEFTVHRMNRLKRSMRLNTNLISSNASKIVPCQFTKLIHGRCSIGKTFTWIQSESYQNSHSLFHPRSTHAASVTRIDRCSCSSYRSTPFHENYRQTLASVEHRSPPFALGTMEWCVHAKLDDESRIWKRTNANIPIKLERRR